MIRKTIWLPLACLIVGFGTHCAKKEGGKSGTTTSATATSATSTTSTEQTETVPTSTATPQPFKATASLSGHPRRVTVNPGSTTSDFQVTFTGLICHAKLVENGPDTTPRRAILVNGDPGMAHDPRLTLDKPADATALQNLKDDLSGWTGNTPTCNSSACTVDITGADVRIRGDGGADGSTATGSLGNDPTGSFTFLPPHLRQIAGATDPHSAIQSALIADPVALPTLPLKPADPAEAFFEVDGGGVLAACPFSQGGFYDNDQTQHCTQFAASAFWVGKTSGVAVVQIRSAKTGNQWKTVRTGNAGTLNLTISNEASGSGMSSAHFGLFKKMLTGAGLPKITTACKPDINATCTSMSALIPGCSDTQYP